MKVRQTHNQAVSIGYNGWLGVTQTLRAHKEKEEHEASYGTGMYK